MADDRTLIYWEPQEAALCAVHAINNLMQFRCIDEWQLSQIAQKLTEHERQLMAEGGLDSEDFLGFMAKDNPHVDESGNFSVEVIRTALQNFGLQMHSLLSEQVPGALADPLSQQGFICNLDSHWFAIRKLSTEQGLIWFNLDSMLRPRRPQLISNFYLDAFLRQLQTDGYSIFVVQGNWPKLMVSPRNALADQDDANYFSVEQIQVAAEKARQRHQKGGNDSKRPRPRQSTEEEQFQAALRASLQEPELHSEEEDDEALNAALALSISSQQEVEQARDDDDQKLLEALQRSLEP